MAKEFPFALVTPERTVFEGDVTEISLRAGLGDITFLAQHTPFIGTVEVCPLRIGLGDGSTLAVAVDGGFVRANGSKVSVVTPSATLASELEEALIEVLISEAEKYEEAGDDAAGELWRKRISVRQELASKRLP